MATVLVTGATGFVGGVLVRRLVADGITEGLIQSLSGVQGLNVISRAGVERFRHDSTPIDSIARTLEAGTLVRGAVTPEGDKLKISLYLVDGKSGKVSSKDKLPGDVSDIAKGSPHPETKLAKSPTAIHRTAHPAAPPWRPSSRSPRRCDRRRRA